MARVLKPPSQMLGLALGCDGLSPEGSLGGRVCLSGLRGSEGGWERGGGAVGKGLVGWGSLSGGPAGSQRNTSYMYPQHVLLQLTLIITSSIKANQLSDLAGEAAEAPVAKKKR